jgi:hypothetical protein
VLHPTAVPTGAPLAGRAAWMRGRGTAEHTAATGVAADPPEGGTVANPMTKKNPLLSIWLSAANAWAGAARGLMAAEMRRGQKRAVKAATRPPPARGKRRGSK